MNRIQKVLFLVFSLLVLVKTGFAFDSWLAKTSMLTARYYLCAGVVGDRLYAIGSDGGTANEEYDPIGNAWQSKTAMPTGRYWGFAVGVVNGKIYAIGGAEPGAYLTTNEEYDPAGNSWTTKDSMPTRRCGLAIGVAGGRIYAIGGANSSGLLNTNEEYDPVANTWTARAPMPTPRYFLAIGVIDNIIYAIGGYDENGACRNVEAYDPVANTWQTKASMPTARAELAVSVLNQRIYAIGGYTGAAVDTNEEYNPFANTWMPKASMITSRWGVAAGTANGKIYAVGGSSDVNPLATNEEYTGDIPVAVDEERSGLAESSVRVTLSPNPFFGRTTIRFQIPDNGKISLKIYDVSGHLVKSFRFQLLGSHFLVRSTGTARMILVGRSHRALILSILRQASEATYRRSSI